MRLQQILFILILLLIYSCGSTDKKKSESLVHDTVQHVASNTVVEKDTTPKVTGVGGIFFGSENPAEIRNWYGNNLGLAIDDYGSPFEFRNANRPQEKNYLRWSPFKNGDAFMSPSKKEFMINYRVQNLEGLLRKLKKNGVTILDSLITVEYGKFIHIMDPEGNKIELWEPVDSVLTKLGGETTK